MKWFLTLFISVVISGSALAQRTYATGDMTFLVKAAGTDAPSCGSVASPCRTKQGAVTALMQYDMLNHNPTISDPDCADSGPLAFTAPVIGVQSIIIISGSPAPNSTPCLAQGVSGSDAMFFDAPGKYTISGFKLVSSGGSGGGNDIQATRGARVYIGANMILGAAGTTSGARTYANGGDIVYIAPPTFAGSSATVDHVVGFGTLGADRQNVTCAADFGLTVRWLGNGGGFSSYTGPITFTGCPDSAVPTKYFVHLGGAAKFAGTVLPGLAPGVKSGGNADDFIDAQGFATPGSLTLWGSIVWAGWEGSATAYYDGNHLRMSSDTGDVVIQNPYLYHSTGGGCTPSTIC